MGVGAGAVSPLSILYFPRPVEFVRLGDRGLVAFSFLRQDVEQHRLVLALEELESFHEQRNVVAVDRAVITQAQLLENHAGHEQVLHAFLDLVRELDRAPAGDRFDETPRLVVQSGVGRVGDDVVQIARDRADVLGDGPFVVVQDDDEAPRLRFRVVERFITDPAGEGGIAGHDDDVLVSAAKITADRHPQPRGQGGAGVSGAVAIVLALRPEKKAVQPLVLPHGADAIEPAGKHFVDVTLVADVEDKFVLRRFENAMQRDRQLDHAEVRTEMAAGLRQDFDQLVAHFLRELRQILFAQRFDVRRRMDAIEQPRWRRRLRRV